MSAETAKHEDETSTLNDVENIHQMFCSMARSCSPGGDETNISNTFFRGLTNDDINECGQDYDWDEDDLSERGSRAFLGLPRRPFSVALVRRIHLMIRHPAEKPLPASHFSVEETQVTGMRDVPDNCLDCEAWRQWIRKTDEENIMRILGLRRTVGTVSKQSNDGKKQQYLFPPTIDQLLSACTVRHKPNTKSSLSVSARALAKHAHRGEEAFFGPVKGSESQKNEHAISVVRKLINEAAWINIHSFGGTDESRPVLEIRVAEGYGARWSAVWRHSPFEAEDVQFRGFLEPNMTDGHEKDWRH